MINLLKQKPTVDFARNKSTISEGNITTNLEKYANMLHLAVGMDNGGISKTLEKLSEMKDDAKVVEVLRMIVEHSDLKHYMRENI